MRIALIGFGKMGRTIHDLLPYKGISCSNIVTRDSDVDKLPFHEIDLFLDFSSPHGLLNRVEAISFHKKPFIIGTTGWEEMREQVFGTIERNKSTLLWAPNFSIGVALHSKVCQYAAQLFSSFPDFDVGIFERHHRQKADHPSGTAYHLSEILLEAFPLKSAALSNLPQGRIEPNQLHVSYQRVGSTPGYHEVLFENATDTVKISHHTSSRAAQAQGALEAALWVYDRRGIYDFMDMLSDRLEGPREGG